MKAITQEELNALKPSYDKPVELVCFDKHHTGSFKHITCVTPVIKSCFCFIDKGGYLIKVHFDVLEHYILKKQTNEVELFMTVDEYSNMEFCDSDGAWYNFIRKQKCEDSSDRAKCRKKNRQPNPVAILNLDSYELRWL